MISPDQWGEYSGMPRYECDLMTHDFQKLLLQGAVNLDTHRPEPESDESTDAYAVKLPAELGAMNETILHSIQLCPYIEKMEDLLSELQEMEEIDGANLPIIPPIPEKPLVIERLPMVPLSKENTRYLLRKSCATVIAHVGFTQASSMVEDVLSDVLHEFLRRLMFKLRTAVDQFARSGPLGFSYPLFRAFAEMSIQPLEIRDYYHAIKKHSGSLVRTAKILHKDCVDIVHSRVKEVKPEIKTDYEDENIPELHFPALREDQLQSSLEPGFQMLDSLEHDESLQNLDADEEIIVNDSPTQEYVLSTSSDFSSPDCLGRFVKKRKLM